MRYPRMDRRGSCLDLAHRNPDLTCPYCSPVHDDQADIINTARRRQARTAAEEQDNSEWSA